MRAGISFGSLRAVERHQGIARRDRRDLDSQADSRTCSDTTPIPKATWRSSSPIMRTRSPTFGEMFWRTFTRSGRHRVGFRLAVDLVGQECSSQKIDRPGAAVGRGVRHRSAGCCFRAWAILVDDRRTAIWSGARRRKLDGLFGLCNVPDFLAMVANPRSGRTRRGLRCSRSSLRWKPC